MHRNFSSKVEELASGVIARERSSLAKAITLIESQRLDHREEADMLLNCLSADANGSSAQRPLPYTLRIGIAGPPGAGKSTFIEQLGITLIKKSHKVAVIPVDPSSHVSGGSILGDKTRMTELSRSSDAYVRASPTRGVLGGIAEHTVDVISLCESAGYDAVIVESVGLGQSEVEIDSAVDMLILIVPPGGGDSLQAAKKGIMEAVDLVLVNKADGNLLDAAKHTKADYSGSIQFIRQKHDDWRAKVLMISAKTQLNMDDTLKEIYKYHETMFGNGYLFQKRADQRLHWMRQHFYRRIIDDVESNGLLTEQRNQLKTAVENGGVTARRAAKTLHESYMHQHLHPTQL